MPVEVPETWSLDCPAIVGMPVLHRLRIMTDFPHDRVSVLPERKMIGNLFAKTTLE